MVPWSNHGDADRVSPRSGRDRPAASLSADPALEREILQAMKEFERGDYIELTVEQLEHCAATGESPWFRLCRTIVGPNMKANLGRGWTLGCLVACLGATTASCSDSD